MSREDAAVPHSSTSQWQSFEMRMRQRRAERCLRRAETALEAGRDDDAREAIEEARILDASTPEFESVRTAVAERQQEAQRGRVRSGRRLGVAASLVLITAVGVGTAVWQRARSPLAPLAGATPAETAPQPPAAAAPLAPQNAQLEVVTATSNLADSANPLPPAAQQPFPTPEFSVASLPAVGREVEIAVPAIPAAEKSASDVGTPVPDLPALPFPEVAAPPPAPRTAAAVLPVDEGPRVRAALAQYESAYSTLDVSAAQSIWPGVDARALARAFEGLESQRVSLGSCSVAIDGASARADCRGTASWTPKIGGGTQSGSRTWQFELRKVDGAWQIVRADVR